MRVDVSIRFCDDRALAKALKLNAANPKRWRQIAADYKHLRLTRSLPTSQTVSWLPAHGP